MRFVTIFERAESVHLKKDVGQIPLFFKEQYNIDSEIWTFNKIDEDTTKLKIKTINAKWWRLKFSFKLAIEIMSNAKKIDILNVYHFRLYSLIYAKIYKCINKKGVVYMKGDFDVDKIDFIDKKTNSYEKLLLRLANDVDLISYEHKSIESYINRVFKKSKKIFIPNSPSIELMEIDNKELYVSSQKDEILKILIIGRIGSYQKNTEEAFEILKNLDVVFDNWEALVVGEITKSFKEKIENTYKKESFFNKIKLKGLLVNSNDLASIYKQADILLMTSRHEGFPLVSVEAGYFGTCIVANKTSGVNELVKNEINGYIYSSISDAVKYLSYLFLNNKKINEMKQSMRIEIENNSWNKTLPLIFNEINKLNKG